MRATKKNFLAYLFSERSRHETVNKGLRKFCLKERFRTQIVEAHDIVFTAVAVKTQLSIENGEPLFISLFVKKKNS